MTGMSKRWLLPAALVVSVGVNLLVAGVVIGKLSRGPGRGAPPPLTWTVESLPPAVRDEVRQQLRDHRDDVRPLRREMLSAMQAVRQAAAAEPLDAEALRTALAQLRGAQEGYQAFLHDNVVELAVRLPREQRLALLRQALGRADRGMRRGERVERPHPPPPDEHL